MALRSASEVYAALLAAGWPADLAVTMTAIAGAESGFKDDELGDTQYVNATWGPSFGLFQIRTLKADTGTGTDRDIARLSGSDVEQARAAYAIYQRAGNFTPWTVYRTGAYLRQLPAAQAASKGPLPTVGPDWAPWNWPSEGINATVTAALSGSRHIALEGLAAAAGLALIGFGLWRMTRGPRRTVSRAVIGI